MLKVFKYIIKFFHPEFSENANLSYQASNATSGKGTSREAGNINFITILIIVGQESVSGTDILFQAGANSTSPVFIEQAWSSPDSGLIVDNLLNISRIFGFDGMTDASDIGRDLRAGSVIIGTAVGILDGQP